MLHPSNHRRSRLQESRAEKDYGGKRTPGSGNQWHTKGDVKTDRLLVECKTTVKKSYSLKLEDLVKHMAYGILENKIPVFEIEFSPWKTFIVLDKEDFLELLEGE